MHRYASSVASHVGWKRTIQEDAVLGRPEIGLWAVVDGMGGHHRGDIASQRIVERLAGLKAPGTSSSFLVTVQASLSLAHDELNALPAPGDSGPAGATCVVLMAWRDHFTCLWAGDARLYQLRDKRLRQITHDHSHLNDLIATGELDVADAAGHPEAHMVTRAIGAGTLFQPEVARGTLRRGDGMLLCSDGVTRVLDDATLEKILASTAPEAAADTVIEAVLDGGAPDNASAVVVTML